MLRVRLLKKQGEVDVSVKTVAPVYHPTPFIDCYRSSFARLAPLLLLSAFFAAPFAAWQSGDTNRTESQRTAFTALEPASNFRGNTRR